MFLKYCKVFIRFFKCVLRYFVGWSDPVDLESIGVYDSRIQAEVPNIFKYLKTKPFKNIRTISKYLRNLHMFKTFEAFQ